MKVTIHPLGLESIPPGLNTDQELIRRLEESFGRLTERAGELADRFYGRLFKTYPDVKRLFPEDMSGQKKKLTAALSLVVANLRTPDQVRGTLRELGQRHVGYGTKTEHYEMVCQCLVAAMAEVAGPGWSKELASDWLTALRMVSRIMLDGAAAAKQ